VAFSQYRNFAIELFFRKHFSKDSFIDLFRYSYKVVEPEAPVAEESRSVAGLPVGNIIQASAEKEVEEELAAAITEIEANDSAQSVGLVEEEEEEPVAVTQATPASYYYRFY
jgi:hypothetical protein